jgi:hypothetical protein
MKRVFNSSMHRNKINMGLLASSSSSSCSSSLVAAVTVVLGLLFNAAVLCHGGISSTYRRSATELNIDMPVDSDTFYVPPGKNAPQQVFFSLSFLLFLSSPPWSHARTRG